MKRLLVLKVICNNIMRKMRFRLIIIMRIFAVIRWHFTNEKSSAQEYIDVNCNYPGDWDGAIERIDEI